MYVFIWMYIVYRMSLVFHIIEPFGFSIGYNGEFDTKKIVTNQKLKISKIPNEDHCEDHLGWGGMEIQEKFQTFVGVAF